MAPSDFLTSLIDETVKGVRNVKARVMAKQIAKDPMLNDGIVAMMERHSEMRSPMTALLAGIAANPIARRLWEEALDKSWAPPRGKPSGVLPEVVVGSGLHAAIYVAKRVEMGFEPPVVLEEKKRVGGVFAASKTATFYLNSRNRPGGLSIPRNEGALNFLPGSMVQPSDLSAEEYQVNADLAFVIRSVFALSGAKVLTAVTVESFYSGSTYDHAKGVRQFQADLYTSLGYIKARRAILATGIGRRVLQWGYSGTRLLPFMDFLGMLDEPFPFRGVKRVAVIGAGDSGKCAVEALTGQGPARHMSVASLDWLEEIRWYGQESSDRYQFEECNRPRYKRIGTLLESNDRRRARVRPEYQRATVIEEGYDCVRVNGLPFDLVIDCTGYTNARVAGANPESYDMNPGQTARVVNSNDSGPNRIWIVGPAAQIPTSESERMATPLPTDPRAQREALVAAYRYAGKTAMLAERLP